MSTPSSLRLSSMNLLRRSSTRWLGRIVVCALATPLAAEVILTMKSGERYDLPQPPRHKNGMLSFTTADKRFLTVRESEVAKEETVVPRPPKVKLDRTDTRQLGAIAREQRAERGITADVAGKKDASAAVGSEPAAAAGNNATGAGKTAGKETLRHGRKTKRRRAKPPPPPPPAATEDPPSSH